MNNLLKELCDLREDLLYLKENILQMQQEFLLLKQDTCSCRCTEDKKSKKDVKDMEEIREAIKEDNSNLCPVLVKDITPKKRFFGKKKGGV